MFKNFVVGFEQILVNNIEGSISDNFAQKCDSIIPSSSELLNDLLNGNYEALLKHSLVNEILKQNNQSVPHSQSQQIIQGLQNSVKSFLSAGGVSSGDDSELNEENSLLRQLIVLGVGVSCLQLFVQNNWVGPPSLLRSQELLPPTLQELLETENSEAVTEYLRPIGEESIYSLATQPLYLCLARLTLFDFRDQLFTLSTSATWLMRCLYIQQQLLDERSPSLKSAVLDVIQQASAALDPEFKHGTGRDELNSVNESDAQNSSDSNLPNSAASLNQLHINHCIQFHIEAGYIKFFFYESVSAAAHMQRARELSHLTLELTGALGKRTRFQEKDLSQLILLVSRGSRDTGSQSNEALNNGIEKLDSSSVLVKCDAEVKSAHLPKNVSLDDEAVLEVLSLKNPDEVTVVEMSALEQALTLSLCYQHRRMHEDQDKIIQEESMAYVNCVLSQPKNWCVQSKAVLLRTRWEKDSARRMQRSLAQLEELVNQFKKESQQVSAQQRLSLVYTVALPPRWVVECELGRLLSSIGATASALEVYLRLHMWDEIIQCYAALGQLDKAEKVIREQLSVSPSPTLWCYLGDVLHNPEFYHTAWEVSEQKSMRAQRCLAYYHLRKQEFRESLEHFDKCLQRNPLQAGVWFSYGCASLSSLEYDRAANAFRHCVNLEHDNHEAWSNLATAYIRLNNKPRAFLTLQEALKCEYENWRIWENYIHVAADIGDFQEVIRSYHRLIDLKQKYSNVDVVAILVQAIQKDLPDIAGESSLRLRHKALELMGRITSQVTSNSELWRLYAELLSNCPNTDLSDVDHERALQYRQKAQRCAVQVKDWEVEVKARAEVMKLSIDLANAYVDMLTRADAADDKTFFQRSQYKSSARLMLRGVISKMQKRLPDEPVSTEGSQVGLDLQITQLQDILAKHFID